MTFTKLILSEKIKSQKQMLVCKTKLLFKHSVIGSKTIKGHHYHLSPLVNTITDRGSGCHQRGSCFQSAGSDIFLGLDANCFIYFIISLYFIYFY